MRTPYIARICTAIDGLCIELARFSRPIHQDDISFWTDGRSRRTWVEIPLRDAQCISARWEPPVSAAAHYARARKARKSKEHL